MKKFLKYLLLTIIIIPIVFLLGIWVSYKYFVYPEFHQASNVKNVDGDYCWGFGCRKQEKTWEEFLPVFSEQMRLMSKAVAEIWPGADYSQMKTYIVTKDKAKAWLVDTNDNIREINAKDIIKKYRIKGYDMEFSFDDNEAMTMILVVSNDEMADQKGLESYPYLGTYDPILTVVHEGFHRYIQDKSFASPNEQIARVDVLNQTEARIMRMYIAELFRQYLIGGDKILKDKALAQAKYIFEKYKKQNPNEYQMTLYFDSVEGTAHYIEILASLVWRNAGIYDKKTLQKMLSSMYKFKKDFKPGATNEAYYLGAMAGFILDEKGDLNWQELIKSNPKTSPVVYLFNNIESEKVEIPSSIRQQLLNKVEAERNHGLYWKPLIKMVYDIVF